MNTVCATPLSVEDDLTTDQIGNAQHSRCHIDWVYAAVCPACDAAVEDAMPLPDSGYKFGTEHIDFPAGGVAVANCSICGFVFKTVVPASLSLSQALERQAGKKQLQPYDFKAETRLVRRLANGESFDVLDIGSGSGAFLGALGGYTRGRRSALDVVQQPGCSEHICGEFIRGLLDSRALQWSQQPYDIVTLFDVLEHLYEPQLAFHNLRSLVRNNGLVLIETGNIDSQWPRRFGAQHWWYVRLFEHHGFWSRRSLEQIAAQFGFQLLIWQELRHKTRHSVPLSQVANQVAQIGLYKLAPRAYPSVAPLLGKYWTQPWSPFVRDHFRVVLRKL